MNPFVLYRKPLGFRGPPAAGLASQPFGFGILRELAGFAALSQAQVLARSVLGPGNTEAQPLDLMELGCCVVREGLDVSASGFCRPGDRKGEFQRW